MAGFCSLFIFLNPFLFFPPCLINPANQRARFGIYSDTSFFPKPVTRLASSQAVAHKTSTYLDSIYFMLSFQAVISEHTPYAFSRAAMAALPPYLIDVATALDSQGRVNVIGMVVDTMTVFQSKNSSYLITFTIKDCDFGTNAWQGLKVKYFHRKMDSLPDVKEGHVIVLRNLRVRFLSIALDSSIYC